MIAENIIFENNAALGKKLKDLAAIVLEEAIPVGTFEFSIVNSNFHLSFNLEHFINDSLETAEGNQRTKEAAKKYVARKLNKAGSNLINRGNIYDKILTNPKTGEKNGKLTRETKSS